MFNNVTLEISLKPFKETSNEYIESVCRTMFEQWRPLIKNRPTVSVMLWSADGSELLDYKGELAEQFEWCRYIGLANFPLLEDGEPPETSLHVRKQLYMENPPVMTYKILKTVVETFKRVGKELFPSAKIKVGTTFDIGGEFAVSDFKYNRHKEVCKGSGCGVGFISASSVLNGDDFPYAAFPNGIPDKTPFGTFFGAQANAFMTDMGFDFIWLSNGFGFSYEPWRSEGVVYSNGEFHLDNLKPTKEALLNFWRLFRKECPDFEIATRGTNYSVGVDYASDGVPLYDIYKENPDILPPPNSPWAALNDNIGIEVIGQLTRNCEIPGKDYMFRFYAHDIWWVNSPWYDRYNRSPYDIYLPMALSRIDENGKVQSPTLLNILSVDNSFGDMPEICTNEIMPHLLQAEKDTPDEPSPTVLVYPFREYTSTENADMLSEMYFGDLFLQDAVNNGFPVATAVSTDNFLKTPTELYDKSILLVPAMQANDEFVEKLADYARKGGKIIAFGNDEHLKNVDFPCKKVDIKSGIVNLFSAFGKYGYRIGFEADGCSLPSLTLHRSDNAMIFSVYNRITTVETSFKFPLGAPILDGFSTKLRDGAATYRFNKCVHAECRVFVKQNDGIVSVKEAPPVNGYYRRKIKIMGLKNADIALFGEEYCKGDCIVTYKNPDDMPIAADGFEVVSDKENGTYLYGRNISGTVYLCMPKR